MHNPKNKWLNFLFEYNLNLNFNYSKKKLQIKKITMVFYYIEY